MWSVASCAVVVRDQGPGLASVKINLEIAPPSSRPQHTGFIRTRQFSIGHLSEAGQVSQKEDLSLCCWMQCGEARILVAISCSYSFVGSWQWRPGHSGRTGSSPGNPVKAEEDWELQPDDHLSRILQGCTLSSGSVNASFRLYLQCYGGSIQPPASVSRCAMQMLECCLHPPQLSPASPVQPSPARLCTNLSR